MRELEQTFVALGVGVAIAAIVACGGSNKMATTAAMPGMAPDAGMAVPADKKAAITKLDEEITRDFAKLDAGPRPPPAISSDCPGCTSPQQVAVKPGEDPACVHGDSQTCKDTCQLADAICDAATKICGIAKDLGNDAWANEKCTSGSASCEKSRTKCCGCL